MLDSDLRLGSELLGYRVEGLLGRGGMGVVYLAEDVRLGRRVALKVLAPSLAGDERFRDRFFAESRLAASLDHPCVVPIYEAGEEFGRLLIAMRYVAGCDLRALLREGPLTAERAVAVCAQVADALDFAHGRRLVHRDVKPSNVLLDGDDHVYLADFGLTKRLGEPQAVEPGLLGTTDYVAPEQIRGEEVDGRADQYSLGCVLYECLIGAPPFVRSTDAAVLFAHLEEQPLAPPGLEGVMQTALAKEPADRYSSCAELVEAAGDALGLGARARLHKLTSLLTGAVCPFKGLAFFDRSDAEYFCGRERVVSEVVAQLAASTLVGILAPSGIGKSSLLRAGVLPALSAGVLPGSSDWRQVLLRPGQEPMGELTRLLGGELLGSALAGLEDGERIVVAVDQLEEVFTACEREQARAAFLGQLAVAARDRDRRALVLVSLRADYYGRFVSYPGFAQLLSGSHVLIGPMERNELARAIEKPAARAGLVVEPTLVDALVSDVIGEPGGLPLLSTMLLELWQARDGRTLRHESYLTSGGVRGAVGRLAERAFAALGERERAVAREVLLRLVRDEGATLVRRRVPLGELEQVDGAERVLAALTEARLVTVSDDEAEVSHEALLEEWPRYRGWLEEDRAGRRVHAHLATAAREWDSGGRDPGDLYRGSRLAGAQDWAAEHGDLASVLERDFLQVSEGEAQREVRRERIQNRRLRSLLIGVGGLLAIAVIAAILALAQQQSAKDEAQSARNEARVALAGELAAKAANESRIDQAMLLAREAVNLDRSLPSESTLLATLVRNPAVVGTFGLPANSEPGVVLSPAGRTLVAADATGGRIVWFYDTRTHSMRRQKLSDFIGFPKPVYSPDGSLLVYVTGNVALAVRDARTLTLKSEFSLGPGRPTGGVLIAPDSRSVYYPHGGSGSTTYVDRRTLHGRLLARRRIGPNTPLALRLVDAGKRLVVVGPQAVSMFDAHTLNLLRSTAISATGIAAAISPVGQAAAAISPDGQTVVFGSRTGSVSFVDASTGSVRLGHGEPAAGVESVVYAPNGRSVVTVGNDGKVIVWDPNTAAPSDVLTGPAGQIIDATISRDAATLYTVALDGVVLQWDLTGKRGFGRSSALGADVHCCGQLSLSAPPLALSPDGSLFATRLDASTVGVFSARTLQRKASFTIRTADSAITALAWSPSAPELAVAGTNRLVQLWRVRGVPHLMRSLSGLPSPPGGDAIHAIAFSPDGELLAASDEAKSTTSFSNVGGHLAIWRVGYERPIVPPRDLLEPPTTMNVRSAGGALALSHANLLAVTQVDGDVLVLDATTGQVRQTLSPLEGASSLAFARDGTLAIGTYAGTVEQWNPNKGTQAAPTLSVGPDTVTGINFDPTGQRFATTASQDGTVKLWSTSALQQEGPPLQVDRGATATATFGPRGGSLLVIDDRGNGFSWPTSLAAWEHRACLVAGRNFTRQEWTQFISGRSYANVCP